MLIRHYEHLALQIPGFGKGVKTTIISLLYFIGETARRQLLHAKVILQAFATDAFFTTTIIAAVAPFQILLLLAFHNVTILGWVWRQ